MIITILCVKTMEFDNTKTLVGEMPTYKPEFDLQNAYGGWGEPSSASCPLTYMWTEAFSTTTTLTKTGKIVF